MTSQAIDKQSLTEAQTAFLDALGQLWETHFKDQSAPTYQELMAALDSLTLTPDQFNTIKACSNINARGIWENPGMSTSEKLRHNINEPIKKIVQFQFMASGNARYAEHAADRAVLVLSAQAHNIGILLGDKITPGIQRIIDDEKKVAELARAALPQDYVYPTTHKIVGLDYTGPLPENF